MLYGSRSHQLANDVTSTLDVPDLTLDARTSDSLEYE